MSYYQQRKVRRIYAWISLALRFLHIAPIILDLHKRQSLYQNSALRCFSVDVWFCHIKRSIFASNSLQVFPLKIRLYFISTMRRFVGINGRRVPSVDLYELGWSFETRDGNSRFDIRLFQNLRIRHTRQAYF
jgi:hypothetical protein